MNFIAYDAIEHALLLSEGVWVRAENVPKFDWKTLPVGGVDTRLWFCEADWRRSVADAEATAIKNKAALEIELVERAEMWGMIPLDTRAQPEP